MITITDKEIRSLYQKLGVAENVPLNQRTKPNPGTLYNKLNTNLNTNKVGLNHPVQAKSK